MDPHQANLQPNLLLFGSCLRSNPTPTFFGVPFDRTFFFTKHVSSLKAKFSLVSRPYAVSLLPHKSPSLLYKAFLWPLLTYALPGWFTFSSVTNITKLVRLHQAASRAITGCISSSPIFLLSKASLPPLRFTLIHFALSSYEWALRLPTSFPISGLARLGVKPRLYRSSWRAFASTHSLMLHLLACPPFFPWNLPSFIVESTLSSSCSRSDSPLFCRGAVDSLSPHDLVLWIDGSVPFVKGGSGILANCSLSLSL